MVSYEKVANTAMAILLCASIPAVAEEMTTFSLDNGLKVVVIEDHRAPVVTQMIWYKVGAADEPLGKSGIAHFLEHLMFKGTQTLAPGEFSAVVEENGGNDNAFTSWDYTAYYQRVAADRLGLMMKIEADRMRNLQLDDKNVRTERDVVIDERRQRIDSRPGALFFEQINAAQYLNHPYRVPVIGWMGEIEQLNTQDALDFYKLYYAPNNATLVVAGDVTPDEVRVLAQKYYGSIAPSDGIGPRIRPQEPPQVSPRRLSYSDERVSEPQFIRSYLAPNRHSGDQSKAAALTILAEILGGNDQTSYLAQELQYGDDPIAIATGAYYNGSTVDKTSLSIYALPSSDKDLAELEAGVDKVISDLISNGPNLDDLERIKTQIMAQQIYDRDDIGRLARLYGAGLTVGLSIEDIQSWPEVLNAVTADDIVAAAKEVLVPGRSVTGWLLPEEQTAPSSALLPAGTLEKEAS